MIFGFGICPVTLKPTILKINYPLYTNGPWYVSGSTLNSRTWYNLDSDCLPRPSIRIERSGQAVIDGRVEEFSPSYYISQLGDSLIISGSFGFEDFHIIYAWALDFQDGFISSYSLLFIIRHPPEKEILFFENRTNLTPVKDGRIRLLISSTGSSSTSSYSSEPSLPNSYSSGTATPQNHHSRTPVSGECSSCKPLLGKIKVPEAAIEMHMHPEQHIRNSTALLQELYNDMDNLGLE
nr:hypothetical protein [Tanacetum cinerariifolium]